MATTTVTPDLDTIVSEIDIAAPIERVFKAISDSEEVRRRSPGMDTYEMDLRVGGRWFFEMRPPQPYKGYVVIRHEGEVLELDPPRLLAYTWLGNFHNNPQLRTIVRWELTPTKRGTHVRLTHSGLATEPDSSKAYSQGWPGVLAELKTYVDSM